jgi:hypothetical protein
MVDVNGEGHGASVLVCWEFWSVPGEAEDRNGRVAPADFGSHKVAGSQGCLARGYQPIQENSRSGASPSPRPQREPLLSCLQVHVRHIAAPLCTRPTHRGRPGTHADDLGASQFDCHQVRHVRPTALHPLVPSHRGRDALLVASHPAGFFGNYLSTLGCSCLGPKNTSDDKQMQSNPAFLAEHSNRIEIARRLRTRTHRRMQSLTPEQ